MSGTIPRFAHVERFPKSHSFVRFVPAAKAEAAREAEPVVVSRLTVEGFRVSRYNKICTVAIFIVLFFGTALGNYSMPVIQYGFTFALMISMFYGVWTFGDYEYEDTEPTDGR